MSYKFSWINCSVCRASSLTAYLDERERLSLSK